MGIGSSKYFVLAAPSCKNAPVRFIYHASLPEHHLPFYKGVISQRLHQFDKFERRVITLWRTGYKRWSIFRETQVHRLIPTKVIYRVMSNSFKSHCFQNKKEFVQVQTRLGRVLVSVTSGLDHCGSKRALAYLPSCWESLHQGKVKKTNITSTE